VTAANITTVFPGAQLLANVDYASWWVDTPASQVARNRLRVNAKIADHPRLTVEWGKLPKCGGVCVVGATKRDVQFYRALLTGRNGRGLIVEGRQTFVVAPTLGWDTMRDDVGLLIDIIEASYAKLVVWVGDAMRWWRGDFTGDAGKRVSGYVGVFMGGVDLDQPDAGWISMHVLGAEQVGGRAGVDVNARVLAVMRELADTREARDLVAFVMRQGCAACGAGGDEVVYRDWDGFGWCRTHERQGAEAWRVARDRWMDVEGEGVTLWAK